MTSPLEAARWLIEQKFSPVPIPFRSKNPGLREWEKLEITTEEQARRYFNGKPQNIGVHLGYNGLADVDIDELSACSIAADFLPDTGFTFGRKSKPCSHWFYRSDPKVRTRQYADPLDKSKIVELRGVKADGGIGLQTVVPPSTHESGQAIEFTPGCSRIPQNVDAAVLVSAVSDLAATVLLAKHFPREGSRHSALLALAGLLGRAGKKREDIFKIHFGIYKILWGHAADRSKCAAEIDTTLAKLAAGEKITAFTGLTEYVDPKIVRQATEWFGIKHSPSEASAQDTWDDPVPLASSEPLPLDPGLLPPVFSNFVRALADHTETPAELAALMSLGIVSLSVNGKLAISPREGYTEESALYVCPALPPGNRKTAVVQACCGPVDAWLASVKPDLDAQIKLAVSERESVKKIIERKRASLKDRNPILEQEIKTLELSLPEVPRFPVPYISESTAEGLESLMEEQNERAAVVSDEGGILDVICGRYNNVPNLDIYVKAWSGSSHHVYRRNRHIGLNRPTLVLALSPQPSVLSDLKDHSFLRSRGFLARFLFALPTSPVGYRTHEHRPIPPEISTRYHELITRLLDWQPKERLTLTLDANAQDAWENFWADIEYRMRPGQDLYDMQDWGSKLHGQALRIAANLHAAAGSLPEHSVISEDVMNNALDICTVLISHAKAVFSTIYDSEETKAAKKVLAWLRKNYHSGLTVRDLQRPLQRTFRSAQELQEPLKVLARLGHIRLKKQPRAPGMRGQDPSPWILLNPKSKEFCQ